MHFQFIDLPVKNLAPFESASVTTLQAHHDGSIFCGFSFARPLLLKLIPNENATKFNETIDLKIESSLGKDAIAIAGGLRSTTSGETVFSVLQNGFAPKFIKNMFGKNIESKKGAELIAFLQSGAGGAFIRHSIVQMAEKTQEFSLRASKMPGALIDTLIIGDFVYGITGSSFWKEPYLNPEKREVLRTDLKGNHQAHRDDDGNFWMLGKQGRIYRFGGADIKPKATIVQLPKSEEPDIGFYLSSASAIDGWLYGVGLDHKTLFRLRRNSENYREEVQEIRRFPNPITSLLALNREKNAKLLIAVQANGGAEMWTIPLRDAEDREEMPPVPEFTKEGVVDGMPIVGSLTVDDGERIWGGEMAMGHGGTEDKVPRIVRLASI